MESRRAWSHGEEFTHGQRKAIARILAPFGESLFISGMRVMPRNIQREVQYVGFQTFPQRYL